MVYQYDSETKRQSGHTGRLPIPHTKKGFILNQELKLAEFFCTKGICHYKFIPTVYTVNLAYHMEVL